MPCPHCGKLIGNDIIAQATNVHGNVDVQHGVPAGLVWIRRLVSAPHGLAFRPAFNGFSGSYFHSYPNIEGIVVAEIDAPLLDNDAADPLRALAENRVKAEEIAPFLPSNYRVEASQIGVRLATGDWSAWLGDFEFAEGIGGRLILPDGVPHEGEVALRTSKVEARKRWSSVRSSGERGLYYVRDGKAIQP